MPEKDTETISKWYDALSENYDELYGEEQSQKYARVLQLLGKREFEVVIDVGCGTGRLLELISRRTQAALGVDLSIRMLNKAKRRAIDAGVQLVCADASHLPLRDHVADGVVSVSMSETGTVLKEHLTELSRILTDEATLVMTIFDDKDRAHWKELSEAGLEPVAKLSKREQLFIRDQAKRRVMISF